MRNRTMAGLRFWRKPSWYCLSVYEIPKGTSHYPDTMVRVSVQGNDVHLSLNDCGILIDELVRIVKEQK